MIISRPTINSQELVVPEGSLFHLGEEGIIDIGAFAQLQGYEELIPPQIALANAYLDPRYRFIVGCLSRRTGKTIIANLIGNIVTLFPDMNILIISPDYSLSNISWNLQEKFLLRNDVEITKKNTRDREIHLSNGSMIKLASAGKADSAVGRSYALIIFDEAALHEDGESIFNVVLRPTLDQSYSKAIFISTPRGDNYFKTFYERGFTDEYPNWISIHSTWRDNPRAVEADIEDARRSMSASEFAQEYEASFVTFQGQVFEAFDEENIVQECDIRDADYIMGVDVGYRDPTACVVIEIGMPPGAELPEAVIVDAWEMNERTTQGYAIRLKSTMDTWGVEYIYIDSAAAQTKRDLAELYDISCINSEKSIVDGVSFMRMLIEQKRLKVAAHLEPVIVAIRNLSWDTKAVTEKLKHDKYIHLADAIRYALYTHRHALL